MCTTSDSASFVDSESAIMARDNIESSDEEEQQELSPMVVTPQKDQDDVTPVFVQYADQRNEVTFSGGSHGKVTQISRNENIVKVFSETQEISLSIKSKRLDVETLVECNILPPGTEASPLRALGPTAQREINLGHVVLQIESKVLGGGQPRNGITSELHNRSTLQRVLNSIFRSVSMVIEGMWSGSIVIALKPETDRSVYNLLEALEGDFLEELVQGILENQPEDSLARQAGEPIKMKIELNIPQSMFPKNFRVKQFASRKEMLEEFKISMQMDELDKRQAIKKSSSEMSVVELVRLLIERSEEEMKMKSETVYTIRDIALNIENRMEKSQTKSVVNGTMGLAGIIAAPFTAGLSLVATAASAGVGLICWWREETARVVKEKKVQEQFDKYDNILGHLLEVLTLLKERTDKIDVQQTLAAFVKESHSDQKNRTLKVILEDIEGFEIQEMYSIPLEGKKVPLKELDIMGIVGKFFPKVGDTPKLVDSLRKFADDLEFYQVIYNPATEEDFRSKCSKGDAYTTSSSQRNRWFRAFFDKRP